VVAGGLYGEGPVSYRLNRYSMLGRQNDDAVLRGDGEEFLDL
jgi:hypothetical protein